MISDTHLAGDPLPGEVIEALSGSDMILHAGDIVEMSVLEQLSAIAETVAVRGNMDYGETARVLPERRIVQAAGVELGLVHGWGSPAGIVDRLSGVFEEVDGVVFGHTHDPVVEWRGGVLFFNPGSPTDRRFAKRHTVGLLEVTDKIVPRVVEITGHWCREEPR